MIYSPHLVRRLNIFWKIHKKAWKYDNSELITNYKQKRDQTKWIYTVSPCIYKIVINPILKRKYSSIVSKELEIISLLFYFEDDMLLVCLSECLP